MSHSKASLTSRSKDAKSSVSLSSPDGFDWARVWDELKARFSQAPIRLIPATSAPTAGDLNREFPTAQRIFAVDFYVHGAEKGTLLSCNSGYQVEGRIFNIDHHAPDARWERHVSSGVLACQWVRERGIVDGYSGDVVVINHTDCDSVLAALILTGVLPPHERFERAVVDADHRGQPNDLADLLQACSTTRDLSFLTESLSHFFRGDPLTGRAAHHLEQLHDKRLAVREIFQSGTHEERNGVVFLDSERYLDSDLFLPYFIHARVIVLGCPSEKYPGLHMTRLRLGAAVESGLSLHRLGVSDFDPYFGGRFNAGSNKRGLESALASGKSPTVVSPKAHFERLTSLLA